MAHSETMVAEQPGGYADQARQDATPTARRAAGAWRTLRWLIPLIAVHSLIYVFLVPPWQHYDEPGHFLYAAYIARGGIDAPDNLSIAREVADSMYRHNFWPPGARPDLLSPRPPAIPTDQRHHPPLYYALMAGPLNLLRYLPVETQLYAIRLISAGLMALAALAIWRTARIIVPDEPHIPLALTALMALTPAFSDLMSAFNSDVLMNMAAAAAFLGFALIMRDGWRPLGLTLALLGAAVAMLTKRTAAPLVIPLALALVWGVYRRPIRWWITLVAGSLGIGLLALFSPMMMADEPQARPWLESLEREYLRVQLDAWWASWLDWERAWPWYRLTVEVAHTHFWVRLAWGHVAVLPPFGDWLFAGLSLGALIGLLRGMPGWRNPLTRWQQRWLWLCLLAVIVAWFTLLARLHPLPETSRPYIPRGRYLYWAMIPTIWLLALGWQQLWPERWRSHTPYVLVAIFGIVDLAAIWTLITFYYLR